LLELVVREERVEAEKADQIAKKGIEKGIHHHPNQKIKVYFFLFLVISIKERIFLLRISILIQRREI